LSKPSNVTELRDALLDLFHDIGEETVDLAIAKEKSNAAGKILKSAAVQLEYSKLRGEEPDIPFLK
jgi:hypothetical protein